jgi:hypothetical protein
VKELQQCCILRGIVKSGLKADLINRLDKFENDMLNQPKININVTARDTRLEKISIDTDSIISSQTNTTDASESCKKDRKARTIKSWIFRETFDYHVDYTIEDCWKYFQSIYKMFKII